MKLLSKLKNSLPSGKKEELPEYFFALNIGSDYLTTALWSMKNKHLQVFDTASSLYTAEANLTTVTDSLLTKVLGTKEIEVEKILFGIPDSYLLNEDLKEEYVKVLRGVVKELELQPMAYVATSHALVHFLEKKEGVPTTAILVGVEQKHITTTVVRAGKLDGSKVLARTSNIGTDIEKALLSFTAVETLPSKILLYGEEDEFGKMNKIKEEFLSFQWMSRLSFLHFPKIEILEEDIEISSICFAGGFEIENNVVFVNKPKTEFSTKPLIQQKDNVELIEKDPETEEVNGEEKGLLKEDTTAKGGVDAEGMGFIVGDVASKEENKIAYMSDESREIELEEKEGEMIESEMEKSVTEVLPFVRGEVRSVEIGVKENQQIRSKFIPGKKKAFLVFLAVLFIIGGFLAAYIFIPKAIVKVYVEPRVLEKDAEIIADPTQKGIDEEKRIIPGEIVETEISGTEKDDATGTKEIGDPAKGVVVIRNKTMEEKTLSKGTVLTSSSGLKFTLDVSVSVASRSGEDGTYGKANADVVAQKIGADGNLSSGVDLTIANFPESDLSAKSEGNFSGGTSKQVTVVSGTDQQKLLAQVSSNLRKQAQQKLQEKLPDKKVLEESLSEQVIKKNYSKNINDQANDFSLNLTIKFKGTAYDDTDLRQIVSTLVTTQVPVGFQLSLQDTETQADVSKLETDGRLIFLARFKAKLVPIIDTERIKKEIRGRSPQEVSNMLKEIDHVLGSDIRVTPSIPILLQNLPLLESNIQVEVGLK